MAGDVQPEQASIRLDQTLGFLKNCYRLTYTENTPSRVFVYY